MSEIIHGDALTILRTSFADESVQCCVTSPPYWGLRDYGVAGQLGLEATPELYVAKMVEVFREVKRVLKADGTLWLNLGDSYSGSWGNYHPNSPPGKHGQRVKESARWNRPAYQSQEFLPPTAQIKGLKPKDMVGIPWRVAFALQADGWVLRQEIIWAKNNPMPESVQDRCTKSHEQLFMFAKAKWRGPEAGRFAHISDEDARWLALCIDTEGCIVVKRVKQNDGGADAFGPQVTFGGTHRGLIERFQAITGHGNIAVRAGKNAPMNYWQISNNFARDFLARIYPFLIVKQRQARIGIYVDDLVYYRGGKLPSRKQRTELENNVLLSLWTRNKQCNQFVDPDLSDVPEPQFGRWADCERYYYDAAAIAEPMTYPERRYNPDTSEQKCSKIGTRLQGGLHDGREQYGNGETRNKRTVWTVATSPYAEAHFATFPPKLIEPCILAGCPTGGLVLDPFAGSGTTIQVAQQLGRQGVGIELNPAYIALADTRTAQTGLPL